MAKVKQLTVALENRPGTLAHVAKVLADAKVNVLALLGSTAVAQGSGRRTRGYCSFAYSALASFRMGMSGSASFQRVKKSWYAALALAVSPAIA